MKFLFLVSFVAGMIGCAANSSAEPQIGPPSILAPVGFAGVVDARAEFGRILCRINEERGRQFPDYRACGEILSPSGVAPAGNPVNARDACCYTIVFVPGILGECVAHLATPFSDSHERLRQRGHAVHVVPVKGRASSTFNGQLIAAYLAERESQLGKVILVGYSKGLPDILEALAAYPDANWVRSVKAVVGVAGVVAGTPAADRLAKLYDSLFARFPWASCAASDGGAVDSLTRKSRLEFLARNAPPPQVKFYSLVAMPGSAGVNPLLEPFRRALDTQGANDGQVLVHDAVIPGSFLLGYLNGDHWAVALPFNRVKSAETVLLRRANAFPREVLMDAVLEFVAGTLE